MAASPEGTRVDASRSTFGPFEVFRGEHRRAAAILLGTVVALAALAWYWTVAQGVSMSSPMMASMVASGDPTMVGLFLLVWGAMMVAMMFPAAAPMVQAYLRLARRAADSTVTRASRAAVFLGSYAAVWIATGLAAAGGYLLLGRFVDGFASSGTFAPPVVGGVLLAAGVYQLTPLKDACVSGCRTPFSFLATRWRSGTRGAVRLGLQHAAYCVGCCGLLFAVLFVVGVMSVAWMALLAAVIFVEKLIVGRAGRFVSWGVGGAMATAGAAALAVPAIGTALLAL